MKITWKGNAFFEVEAADKKFFIDPWIKTNPGCPVDFCDLKKGYPDYVFVTHGHPGHWGRGDSVVVSRLSGAPYFAPTKLINYLAEHGYMEGVTAKPMTLGEQFTVNESLSAWLFESDHPEVPHLDPKWGHFPGDPNGLFVFQAGDITLMHVGDTIFGPVYGKLHKKFSRVDVLTFPLWGKGMGGDLEGALKTAKKVISILKPKRVFLHNRLEADMSSWKIAKERLSNDIGFGFEMFEQKIDAQVIL